MEFLQLKYFDAIVKYGSITKAAENLHISQPAVSQSIARLEKELTVPLFARHGKRLKLTNYGTLLYNRLPSILGAIEKTKYDLIEMSQHANLRICLNLNSGSYLIPDIIKCFHMEHPDIKFELLQNTTAAHYDILISSLPEIPPDFKDTVLLDEEILLVVPQNFLTTDENSVALSEFSTSEFISLSPGTVFRSIVDFYCRKAGFSPFIVYESNTPATVRSLVSAGLGVSFWPQLTWGVFSDNNPVKTLHIKDMNCRRTLYCSVPPGAEGSEATQLFKEFLVQYTKAL